MEFIFLGTSSGIPTSRRNVSGLVIKPQNGRGWCLVDCGEGTQHQLLKVPYSLVKLQAIFITHVHGDHCYGLPGLIASATMAGRKDPLTIVAPKNVIAWLEHTMTLTDMRRGYDIEFVEVETLATHSVANAFEVTAVPLSHRVPSWAYVFDSLPSPVRLDEKKLDADQVPRGPTWGHLASGIDVRLEDGRQLIAQDYHLPPRLPQRVIVGGDNDTPDCLGRVIAKADVLIHEATFTQAISDKVGPGPQHSSALKVGQFAQKHAVPNVVLTHFSARYHLVGEDSPSSVECLRKEAGAVYDGRLFLAEDIEHYRLGSAGELALVKELSPSE